MKLRRFLRTAVLISMTLGAGAVAADRPSTISGRVLGEGKPLTGVLISDGCRVGRTNDQGEYQLVIGPDSGRFVFVTTPRGWWSESFYVRVDKATETGQANFHLNPIDQPNRFDFVFTCDLMSPKAWAIPKLKASFREINQLQPTPAFTLVQGDLWLHGTDWLQMHEKYLECLALSKIPVRHGRGNHELRKPFEQVFGPTYYSFDWGQFHFIVLDGNQRIPDGSNFYGLVTGSELAWLKADLAAQPEGKPFVVGVHIPIVSTSPARRTDLKREKAPFWQVPNDELLTQLFTRYGVKLVLQGHMHENERITVGGVEYVESISMCGTWWKNPDVKGFERGVDGSPRGYRIVSVNGTDVTHRYRSSCESYVDRRGEFISLKDCVAVGGKIDFVFNCYDAPNGSIAEARIDTQDWQAMTTINYGSTTITKPHHFRLVTSTDGLQPGLHVVEARVTWPDATVVLEKRSIKVVE
jgi:3',5'-cyclic AMP phosphodiesterase CpdA